MPDTVIHLCQPFSSKAQQPNVHGHTDKLSERHVKTALILLQHGPLIMDLSNKHLPEERGRTEIGGPVAAYHEFHHFTGKGSHFST